MSAPGMEGVLMEVFRRLYGRYGPQGWWPGESRFEVVIGAILTQAVSWRSVERALDNLKQAQVFSMDGLRDVPQAQLAQMLRPCVYFNMKARKLKAFVDHVWDQYGGDLDALLSREPAELREELLSIYGIGEETADDILVYAAGQPSFIIDSYTRRILSRMGFADGRASYRELQNLFHQHLPREVGLFNEYHALLDRHAREVCRKRPVCVDCCLSGMCPSRC